MKLFFGGPSEPQSPAHWREEPDPFPSPPDALASLALTETERAAIDRMLDAPADTTPQLPDWRAWNLTLKTRTPSIAYRA